MPRFVTDKDVAFMQNVNKELLDFVIETPVALWKLSMDETKVNIYGEGTTKVYYGGIHLNCLIDRKDGQVTGDAQTVDRTQVVTFAFLRISLREKNIYPEMGDVIEFNDSYYEINNVVENQLIAGQPYFNYTISCESHLTRRSSLQLEPRIQ